MPGVKMKAKRILSEMVEFDNAGARINGFLCRPDVDEPRPAVALIPAIHGLNDYIKKIGLRLAEQGFASLAVDFHSRIGVPDLSTREKLLAAVDAMPDEQAVSDVLAGIEYLRGLDYIRGDAVGVMGFCIGGVYAYMAGCKSEQVKAVVDFYGMIKYSRLSAQKPLSPIDLAGELKCPLLGHFGENDYLISLEQVKEFKEALHKHGKIYEIYTYPGAGHAFHEDHRREVYRPVAAHTAWERSLLFLRWYLENNA